MDELEPVEVDGPIQSVELSADIPEPEAPAPAFGTGEQVWLLTTSGGVIRQRGESVEDAIRQFNDSGHMSFTSKQLQPTQE